MALRTRQPTGRVPWPLVLVEGPEKAGKSWAAAEFSASDRVGQTYWIDLGEGAADEYGAIPGARYLVVEHDGSWGALVDAVTEVRALAKAAVEAGDPPVVLVIDSMTAEWEVLKDWAGGRAAGSKANKRRLSEDPNAEVQIPMNLWNDATARHRRLMTLLMTFPGIVVATARGKDIAALDANGRPVEGSKDYKVEGQKNLAYDATVWVRMSRDHAPMVVGARSVHAGIRPGVDKPQPVPDFSLDRLIFDLLKCDPAGAHVRDIPDDQAALKAAKAEVWELAKAIGWDATKLAEDYADRMDGADLKAAGVDDLGRYAREIQALYEADHPDDADTPDQPGPVEPADDPESEAA